MFSGCFSFLVSYKCHVYIKLTLPIKVKSLKVHTESFPNIVLASCDDDNLGPNSQSCFFLQMIFHASHRGQAHLVLQRRGTF